MFLSFQGRTQRQAASRLYDAAVRQARRPEFYSDLSVPDTVDGRFELISLHVFLAIDRLAACGRKGRALAQGLFNGMFLDMERSVRELGVGDLSVPRHMKRMMQGLQGRSLAYREALGRDPAALEGAIARNIYGTLAEVKASDIEAIAAYMKRCAGSLAGQAPEALMAGTIVFPQEVLDGQAEENSAAAA